MQIWAIIVDTFRETRDRKVFWVMIAISVMIAAAMACVGIEAGSVNFLGIWRIDAPFMESNGVVRAEVVTGIVVDGIMDTALGTFGILLALIVTTGIVPSMLEPGTIDVLVSKPLSRWKLLFGRYLGALIFVLFQAAVFVGLTFSVCGWRWGVWIPGYWYSVPLIVLLFSYLYGVAVLVAVWWRSGLAALLVTLGAWVGFGGIQSADDLCVMHPEYCGSGRMATAIQTARWVIPKTQDLTFLARRWSGAAPVVAMVESVDPSNEETIRRVARLDELRLSVSPFATIGSSLLFELGVLLLAGWRFARTDF